MSSRDTWNIPYATGVENGDHDGRGYDMNNFTTLL
jgi:hypothetical protein